ncbi:hypothetical protein Ocin01_09117 [Orchesella cincta]|uniref:Uncharacterized protein n=1 Tax=Orchesella cincta TaxID=48709 RepID=A0A1D2MWZ1_ORCCI|nr:hypothetical protein Ocin01_09117 [Orchesella cincta]
MSLRYPKNVDRKLYKLSNKIALDWIEFYSSSKTHNVYWHEDRMHIGICGMRALRDKGELCDIMNAMRVQLEARIKYDNVFTTLFFLYYTCSHPGDNPFYSTIDSMPDIRPRRKSIPLVSELCLKWPMHKLENGDKVTRLKAEKYYYIHSV